MTKVTLDSAGRLPLPRPSVREIGTRTLELVSHSGEHLFFTIPGKEERVILSGLLGEVSVADLLSFFNIFRKTGILRFALNGGTKKLYFQQGEIVFAASTFPEEDLGEVLCALGKVDRETLQKARQFITPHTSVEKVLMEKKAVAPRDLWLATRNQVEAIIFNLFTFDRGGYSFLARAVEKEDIVRLSMSTQSLIMEGLQRVDERALFRRRIPSQDLIPTPTGRKGEGLTAAEERLMHLLREGKLNVRDVLRQGGLEEFEGLRLIHQLLEKGMLHLKEPPTVPVEGELAEILGIFNGALATTYRRMIGRHPEFGREMRCFLRDLPQPYSYVFRDVYLREDGTIDGGRILANLAGLGQEDQKKLLADALGELLYMECMLARRDLPLVESAELVQRVQDISRRIKILIGRKE